MSRWPPEMLSADGRRMIPNPIPHVMRAIENPREFPLLEKKKCYGDKNGKLSTENFSNI